MISRCSHPTWSFLIPWSFVLFRGGMAPGLLFLAAVRDADRWAAVVLVAAFLTDWFDGVLARRWGTATVALRRADSRADVLFYLSVLACAALTRGELLRPWGPALLGLVLLEIVCQISNQMRFGCGTATHAWLCKAWAVVLVLTTVQLFGHRTAGLMPACIALGYVAYLDVLLIVWLLPIPAVDIPTTLHAWRLRRRLLDPYVLPK